MPEKTSGLVGKAGFLPPTMTAHPVWVSNWGMLTQEVNTSTGDQAAVDAMISLQNDVTAMMVVPPDSPQHEIDIAWLKAAHRILHRMDLACLHADLSYLAKEHSAEEKHSDLRVGQLQVASRRVTGGGSSGGGGAAPRSWGGGLNRTFGRKRGFESQNPSVWCPHHKRMVKHQPKDCMLGKKEADKTGK